MKIILSQLGWFTFLKGIDTRVSTVKIEDQSGCMAGNNDILGIVILLQAKPKLVMSSSSYSNSSEVKAGNSEVRRFPGIGFSSCAVPTFSHIQGISYRGFELSFQDALEWSSVLERFRV